VLVVCLLCTYLSISVSAVDLYDQREIEIRLVEIKCTAVGPDPGNNLEVYGNWGYRYNNSYTSMYSCGEGSTMCIGSGRSNVLDYKQVIRVKYGDSISVGGSTLEDDPWYNGDDDLGQNYQSTPERNLGGQDDMTLVSVNFEEGGQKVEAVFEIRTIRFIKKPYDNDWVTKDYTQEARKLYIDRDAVKFCLVGKILGSISGDISTGKISYSGNVTNATISSDEESCIIKYEGKDIDGNFFANSIELKKAYMEKPYN
jgi:hypothetical protein